MDINLSLDDIIKKGKSKNPGKRKTGNNKRPTSGSKRSAESFRKIAKNSNSFSFKAKKNSNTSFKRKKNSNSVSFRPKNTARKGRSILIPDARLKLSSIQDARLKIMQNKNRVIKSRNPLVLGKGSLVDARLKIEAHKQKKQVKLQRNKNSGVTTIGGDGIIERRINGNTFDNGIHVEYEDEDMDLEYETLKNGNWGEKSLLVRRTVLNNDRELRSSMKSTMHDDRMYADSRDNFPSSSYKDSYDAPRSFKDVTRTIANANYRTSPAPVSRKSYSKRSPVRQHNSFSNDRKMRSSRLSPPSHPSPMSRDSSHLIVISNLHENVTGEDIKELFEDVGDLVYAKMIRNGVAEVAYKSERDAIKAVEIYHNRQLDGLPMKCVLVSNQHDSSSRNVPPINTFTSVEPDTHLIKKALFSSQ